MLRYQKRKIGKNSAEELRGRSLSVGVQEILSEDPSLKMHPKVFDPGLTASLNFMPVYSPSHFKEVFYKPFDEHQDWSDYILIIEDKTTNRFQLMMLNQMDVKDISQHLRSEAKKPHQGQRDVKICVYHLNTGIYQQGSDRFSSRDLEKDPQFLRLKTQAKFFNGMIDYTEAELPFLREWIEKMGPDSMHELFNNHILQWKADTRDQYSKSSLEKLFSELIT